MHALKLRAERYSSSSGSGRLSGPLLQSYHGSPRHSFRQKKSPSPAAVLFRCAVLVLALVGCWFGGKHVLQHRSQSADNKDFFASLGLAPAQEGSFSPARFWPPSDLSLKLPRPTWGKKDAMDDDAEAAKAGKGTRAGRLAAACSQQPGRIDHAAVWSSRLSPLKHAKVNSVAAASGQGCLTNSKFKVVGGSSRP